MKISVVLRLVIILSLSFYYSIRGQTPSPQNQNDQVLRVRTNEVRLDVVVKDKKGRPVKDLTSADFEIYEDGVQQRIESFRFVMREATTGNNPEQPADRRNNKSEQAPPAPAQKNSLGLIALVFDRLSPEAR